MELYEWKVGLKRSEWKATGTSARIVSGVILAVLAQAGIACSSDTPTVDDPIAQIQFQREGPYDPPPGVGVVTPSGGLANNGFPALSADKSQIAILYHMGNPFNPGFPIVEFNSTDNLSLLDRITLFPEYDQLMESGIYVDEDSFSFEPVKTRIGEINRRLSRGAFRTMKTLYKLPPHGAMHGVEMFGKRVDFDHAGDDNILIITSTQTGEVELKMVMPVIYLDGSEDPDNHCLVRGRPSQAWYDPFLRILILKMTFSSARDDCDQPDQWHFKRL